jgi:hypothetical protein
MPENGFIRQDTLTEWAIESYRSSPSESQAILKEKALKDLNSRLGTDYQRNSIDNWKKRRPIPIGIKAYWQERLIKSVIAPKSLQKDLIKLITSRH